MTFTPLPPSAIKQAHNRIAPYIRRTPLMESSLLNNMLGHDIIFKVEGFQKIGAFKFRGALNALLSLKEKGELPKEVVTFSSGNHAQGVALAGKLLGVNTTILMTQSSSPIKQQATRSYGANLITTPTRQEAEAKTKELAEQGAYFIHPFDNDMVIAGQGTACLEALEDGVKPNAIFGTCGGGGWLSGTYLASRLLAPDSLVFAGEPLNANDASQSYKTGNIVKFENAPKSIADGALSLCLSPRTFHYLKQLNGFYEVTEEEIIYWTQWLSHLLKTTVEPSSAVAMAAAHKWLKTQKTRQRVLVMLSGGNVAPETYRMVWENNYLDRLPGI